MTENDKNSKEDSTSTSSQQDDRNDWRRAGDNLLDLRRSILGARLQLFSSVLDVFSDTANSAAEDYSDDGNDRPRHRSRRTSRALSDGVANLSDRLDAAAESLRRR